MARGGRKKASKISPLVSSAKGKSSLGSAAATVPSTPSSPSPVDRLDPPACVLEFPPENDDTPLDVEEKALFSTDPSRLSLQSNRASFSYSSLYPTQRDSLLPEVKTEDPVAEEDEEEEGHDFGLEHLSSDTQKSDAFQSDNPLSNRYASAAACSSPAIAAKRDAFALFAPSNPLRQVRGRRASAPLLSRSATPAAAVNGAADNTVADNLTTADNIAADNITTADSATADNITGDGGVTAENTNVDSNAVSGHAHMGDVAIVTSENAITEDDSSRGNALHKVVQASPLDIERINDLLQSNPAAARETDREGRLPLHYACLLPHSEEACRVIEMLVCAYPQGLLQRETSEKRDFPFLLHVMQCAACSYCSPDFVRRLWATVTHTVTVFPSHTQALTAVSSTKQYNVLFLLLSLLSEKKDTLTAEQINVIESVLVSVLSAHAHLAAQDEFLTECVTGEGGNTEIVLPFHRALLCDDCSPTVLLALLNAFPAAASVPIALCNSDKGDIFLTGSGRSLPLHVALRRRRCDTSVIKCIAESFPPAVLRREDGSDVCDTRNSLSVSPTVLHIAIESALSRNKDSAKDGEKMRDEETLCAILSTVLRVAGEEQQRQSLSLSANERGNLPLHSLFLQSASLSLSRSVLSLLLFSAPSALSVRNYTGELPLHCAVRQFCLLLSSVSNNKEGEQDDVIERERHSEDALAQALEQISFLLEHNPAALYTPTYSSLLPLHIAISCRAPTAMITALLAHDTYANTLRRREKHGDLALHLALSLSSPSSSSSATVRAIVGAYPQAVLAGNAFADLPLHTALSHRCEAEIVQFLLRVTQEQERESERKKALSAKNVFGNTPLHVSLIQQSSVEIIMSLISLSPQSLREKNAQGLLPVHVALTTGLAHSEDGLRVIKTLIDACPESVLTPMGLCEDEEESTQRDRTKNVVDKDGKCVSGFLPLHAYLIAHTAPSLAVVQLLLTNFTEAASVKCCDSLPNIPERERDSKRAMLPVHIAVMHRHPLDVVRLLLETHTQTHAQVQAQTQTQTQALIHTLSYAGDSLLHLAVKHSAHGDASLAVVQYLIAHAQAHTHRHSPQALFTKRNARGDLPLHLAIHRLFDDTQPSHTETKAEVHMCVFSPERVQVVNTLLLAHPQSAAEKNRRGNLALHLLLTNYSPLLVMKEREEAFVSLTQELLRVYPQAAKERDDAGRLPVALAVRRVAPLSVVRLLAEREPQLALCPASVPLITCVVNSNTLHINNNNLPLNDSVNSDVNNNSVANSVPNSVANSSTNSAKSYTSGSARSMRTSTGSMGEKTATEEVSLLALALLARPLIPSATTHSHTHQQQHSLSARTHTISSELLCYLMDIDPASACVPSSLSQHTALHLVAHFHTRIDNPLEVLRRLLSLPLTHTSMLEQLTARNAAGRTPLHEALSGGQEHASCDVISLLLFGTLADTDKSTHMHTHSHTHTKISEIRDAMDHLPLHTAIASECSPQIVRMIMSAFPAAVREKNTHEQLPLHIALTVSHISVDVINMLLDAYDMAVRQRDAQQCLPLHLAVSSASLLSCDAASRIIRRLFFPAASKERTQQGSLPLHLLCQSLCVLCARSRERGKEAAAQFRDIFELLLRASPVAAIMSNADADLPIHILLKGAASLYLSAPSPVCSSASSSSSSSHSDLLLHLLQYLLSVSPECATFADREGDVALHLALRFVPINNRRCDEKEDMERKISTITSTHTNTHAKTRGTHCPLAEIVSLLLQFAPETVLKHNKKGLVPLRTALVHCLSSSVCVPECVSVLSQLLADEKKTAVLMKERDTVSRLPFHFALAHKAPWPVLALLLSHDPSALDTHTAQGEHALHIALSHGCETEVVRSLLSLSPSVASAPAGKERDLPLHIAVSSPEACVETVCAVWAAFPAALHAPNAAGNLPLHNALTCGAPLEVVQVLLLLSEETESECESGSKSHTNREKHTNSSTQSEEERMERVRTMCLTPNAHGALPLHCAAMYASSAEVLSLLATALPLAATLEDKNGLLPVQHAFMRVSACELTRHAHTHTHTADRLAHTHADELAVIESILLRVFDEAAGLSDVRSRSSSYALSHTQLRRDSVSGRRRAPSLRTKNEIEKEKYIDASTRGMLSMESFEIVRPYLLRSLFAEFSSSSSLSTLLSPSKSRPLSLCGPASPMPNNTEIEKSVRVDLQGAFPSSMLLTNYRIPLHCESERERGCDEEALRFLERLCVFAEEVHRERERVCACVSLSALCAVLRSVYVRAFGERVTHSLHVYAVDEVRMLPLPHTDIDVTTCFFPHDTDETDTTTHAHLYVLLLLQLLWLQKLSTQSVATMLRALGLSHAHSASSSQTVHVSLRERLTLLTLRLCALKECTRESIATMLSSLTQLDNSRSSSHTLSLFDLQTSLPRNHCTATLCRVDVIDSESESDTAQCLWVGEDTLRQLSFSTEKDGDRVNVQDDLFFNNYWHILSRICTQGKTKRDLLTTTAAELQQFLLSHVNDAHSHSISAKDGSAERDVWRVFCRERFATVAVIETLMALCNALFGPLSHNVRDPSAQLTRCLSRTEKSCSVVRSLRECECEEDGIERSQAHTRIDLLDMLSYPEQSIVSGEIVLRTALLCCGDSSHSFRNQDGAENELIASILSIVSAESLLRLLRARESLIVNDFVCVANDDAQRRCVDVEEQALVTYTHELLSQLVATCGHMHWLSAETLSLCSTRDGTSSQATTVNTEITTKTNTEIETETERAMHSLQKLFDSYNSRISFARTVYPDDKLCVLYEGELCLSLAAVASTKLQLDGSLREGDEVRFHITCGNNISADDSKESLSSAPRCCKCALCCCCASEEGTSEGNEGKSAPQLVLRVTDTVPESGSPRLTCTLEDNEGTPLSSAATGLSLTQIHHVVTSFASFLTSSRSENVKLTLAHRPLKNSQNI